MAQNAGAVLYTSLEADGALGELSYYLSQLTPLPTKPITLHTLHAKAAKALTIEPDDFSQLNINPAQLGDLNYKRCQVIGDAAAFVGVDALLVPSARWHCKNLILLHDNCSPDAWPEVIDSKKIDWQEWARKHNFIG